MNKLLSILDSLNSFVFRIQKFTLVFVVIAMIVINAAQIAGRYVFRYSLPWSEQVSIVLFTVIIMLGGNLAIKQNNEIKITLFTFKNKKKELVSELTADVITVATILIMIFSTILLIIQSSKLSKVVSSIQLQYKYIYMVVLAGFLLILFEKLLSSFKKLCSDNIKQNGLQDNTKTGGDME